MLATLTTAKRLTLVESIGTPGVGGSLAGINVTALPAGALAYVGSINRFYELRKNLPSAVVPDVTIYRNVVAAVGSSNVAGYWVACQQQGQATLVGGEATVLGFDLSRPGKYLYSIVTGAGSIGDYVIFTANTAGSLDVQSADSDDTSTYFFTRVETPA